MKNEVLQAIKDAFQPTELDEQLEESAGTVFGWVDVKGSEKFDSMDDSRRQRALWNEIFNQLPSDYLKVGPIVLTPGKR